MDKLIGQTIDGRYVVESVIGVGGMAVVYKALDKLTETDVAVKVLKEEFMADEQFRRRFITESKAISMLSHKNIVKVLNVSFNSNLHYIVMEYIDGITLKQYIEQQKVLSWKETLYFTVQILDALEHAHQKGIVHRDVKPQNIMLLEDGTIKVTDFGIARFANADTFTMTDKAIGSVHYISPEQVSGSKSDQRADIYSVGVMMFEMLTGSLPFDAVNPVSIAIMQLQNKPKRPTEINPDIPQGLEEIVLKAMAKNPDNRYNSAVEMMTDIELFKQNPSIRFQYQYFTTDSSKFSDAIKDAKRNIPEEDDDDRGGRYRERDRDTNKKKSFMSAVYGIGAAFLVVILLVMGAIFILKPSITSNTPQPKEYKAPSLVGKSYEEVRNSEEYADFEIQEDSKASSDKYEEGQIISQDPKENSIITVESETQKPVIKVVVSIGKEERLMPDYVNTDYRQAETALRNMGIDGLTVKIEKEYNENIVLDNVIRTEPEANQPLEENMQVVLYVSMGKEVKMTRVPNLFGMTEAEAQEELKSYNLIKGNVRRDPSSTLPNGTVVNQSVPPEQEVAENTVVDLEISDAPVVATKSLTIPLPTAPDKETFVVTVKKGDEEIYKKNHSNTDGAISIDVSGSGQQLYTVEIDGVFYDSYTVNFDQ